MAEIEYTQKTTFGLVSAQARRTPNAIAVRGVDGTRTYTQVIEFAISVAAALHADGLRNEEPVAIYMRRTADLPAVLLGIMRARGAYLPIDLQDPPDRIVAMLRIAGCKRVIGDMKTLENLPGVASDFAIIDVNCIVSTHCELPQSPAADSLAYVIFTSGSTGEPKAVEIEHRAMVNVLNAARDLLEFTVNDTFLAVTTLAFDISVIEIFLPLIVGADILLRDKQTLLNPREMARLVLEEGVTAIHTGPSVWAIILSQCPDFPRVRVAVSAGEAVSPELARTISGHADHAWNMYGPTEATIWATGHKLATDEPVNVSDISAPIGTAFNGVTVRIESPDGVSTLQGDEGELLLGGICVARGYRRQPELTEQQFVMRDDVRFYRSGDRVARNADGLLEYRGRFDDQISIQGRRIEPREIETLLENQPGIAQAAATWFETESHTRAIVAAIVPDSNLKPDLAILRRNLSAQVPEVMIPAGWLILDSLPINKNAKVDRAAIRGLRNEPDTSAASIESPVGMTATETVIAEIWGRAMRVENVGPGSHFFEIGGDSLAAVTMNLRLESKLGISLPAQQVLEAPTLGEFAAIVDEIRAKRFVQSNTSYIFPLVERSGTTPVFFVGVDLKMARNWRLPCSLYAIAYWASGGKLIEMETVEQLASNYIQGIQKIQPKGPYRIAGYSFGAVVALEIAQQLHALNEPVEQLFVLDPFQLSRTSASTAGTATRHASTRLGAASRLSNYRRASAARVRRHGLRGMITSLYKPLQKVRGVPLFIYKLAHLELMNQLFRLHRRHPSLVRESLLSRKLWPVFWYSARRKASEYIARPYNGNSLASFTLKQGGESAWAEVLVTGKTQQLDSAHLGVFDTGAADQWQSELLAVLTGPTSK